MLSNGYDYQFHLLKLLTELLREIHSNSFTQVGCSIHISVILVAHTEKTNPVYL